MNYKDFAERMEAEALQGGYDISVLVEDFKDEIFWSKIINKINPVCKIYFPATVNKGKSEALKYKDYVNSKLIICIDCDNEILYKDKCDWLKDFIFHTYVYNVENFQCNPLSLNEICKEVTLIHDYDFESFINKTSEILKPVIYLWLYVNQNPFKSGLELLSVENLKTKFEFTEKDIDKSDVTDILDILQTKANDLISEIQNVMDWYDSYLENDVADISDRLNKNEIEDNDLFLFFNGHVLFEKIITPIFKLIIIQLKNKKISEIKETYENNTEKILNDKLYQFNNISNQDIDTKLSDNYSFVIYNFENDKWMNKIVESLKRQIKFR